MIYSFLKFLINRDFACWLDGGIGYTVHHCSGSAMWRLDSSLRMQAWRSQCLHAYSGLNKTLFASVGPNSHCCGHQLDGTFISRYFSLVSEKLTNAASIPLYIDSIRSCSLPLFSFLSSCFVGIFKVICRLSTFIKCTVSHYGVYNSQQSSAHGNVGFGLSNSFDKPLSDRFLLGIGVAKGYSSLAERPSESGRTGFFDTAGFFVVGSHSRPELQGVGIGESVKRSDFGSNDTRPDFGDTRYTFEDSYSGREFITSISNDYLSPERFSLTLDEKNDINEVSKCLLPNVFEHISAGKEPLLSSDSLEFRSANISGMENRVHTVFDSAERSSELLPVPAKFSQLHQRFVSDGSEWAVSSNKPDCNIEGVVSISFSTFASSAGQFSSIGDVNSFDAIFVSVNEPFDKRDFFYSHPSWFGKIVNPVFDFVDTFGVDGQRTDDVFVGVYGSERNSGFVQIDSDERSEVDAGYVPAFSDSFILFCLNVFHNKFLTLKRG